MALVLLLLGLIGMGLGLTVALLLPGPAIGGWAMALGGAVFIVGAVIADAVKSSRDRGKSPRG